MSVIMAFTCLNISQPHALACFDDINDIVNKQVTIKNDETHRLLFSPGVPIGKPGDEGGSLKSPDIVGADANYYDRALWYLEKRQGSIVIRNKQTNRLAFSSGPIFEGSPGDEGG
ncbi:MAG: hypothetical protein MK289_17935 [Trichodesmium sp. ALOHA_ZT_67]|nr:hypothetical protein [Trichodesmium sp. ALOHA_ZT_67]